MKVYELIENLSKMPAGAIVKTCAIKNESELSVVDDDDEDDIAYGINFEIREVNLTNNVVEIDFY